MEMSKWKSELQQNKQEIQHLRDLLGGKVSIRAHANEMIIIRGEIDQIKRHFEETRLKGPEPGRVPFPTRELDILTSSIAKIGNRASQIETMQMEFEILKGRVERIESLKSHVESVRRGEGARLSQSPPYPHYYDEQRPTEDGAPAQDRLLSGTDVPRKRGMNSSEALAFVSDHVDTPTREHDTAFEWRQSSLTADNVALDPSTNKMEVKLTKSRKDDPRPQKRRSRSALKVSSSEELQPRTRSTRRK
jgi:hypothetical protein